MKYIFILLTCFSTLLTAAQEVHHFDKYFALAEEKKTDYERRYTFNTASNTTSFEDHGAGILVMRGTIHGSADRKVSDEFIRYARNESSVFFYKPYFAALRGEFIEYKESGNPQEQFFVADKQVRYAQAWGYADAPELINGTGRIKIACETEIDTLIIVYADSIKDESYIKRAHEHDTLYVSVDKPAEPKEGMQNFFSNLSKRMRYPIFAQLAEKEGVVYMHFVIDKTGQVMECRPITPDGSVFEKKILKKFEDFPRWNPALVKGRPVKVGYTIPVKFKLE